VINAFKFPDANTMHERMCERLMLGVRNGKDYDWVYGTEVGLHNVTLGCESFDWSFDLKRLWMPRTRWTMMVRQYLNLADLEEWRGKVQDRLTTRKARGIAVLRPATTQAMMFEDEPDGGTSITTNTIQGRGSGRGVRRRWGSCMLAMSFRKTPIPTVTLHSRTTYFGYLAAMDITVANGLAWEAYHITGIHPSEMRFVWNLELAQFHGFRSLAWPLMQPDLKDQMDNDLDNRLSISNKSRPGYRKALDGYWRLVKSDREGKLYGDEAFSSFARVRRRFHTEVMGATYGEQFSGGMLNRGGKGPFPPLPHVYTDELDFSVLRHTPDVPDTEDDDGDE